MNITAKKEVLIVVLCLLIGLALRFYTFEKKSLWIDEVHTFNDSRDDLKDQIKFYKESPTFLHPPLFFVLTHLLYPFEKPERDLRIIPLIAGILSIPMIYFLSKQFSPLIALPCTLSLTFMTYHISLSQEGRSYTLIMFLGMLGLYFLMRYLRTLNGVYLPLSALFLGILFYLNYSSISFVFLSQILWFYRVNGNDKKNRLSSFFVLNGLILLVCLPWGLFVAFNYKSQPLGDPYQEKLIHSFSEVLYWMLKDWTVHLPLVIISGFLFALLLVWLKYRRNAAILLIMIFLPVTATYWLCKLLNINHFISSRYFINFMPIFLISLYLSLSTIESKFEHLRKSIRPNLLFLIFFIASNLVILPLYYKSEKMNLRGLADYLRAELKEGDKIFDSSTGMALMPGLLHYLGTYPKDRQYVYTVNVISKDKIEFIKSFAYGDKEFTIFSSKSCCTQYIQDGSRIWFISNKPLAAKLIVNPSFALKGFFDGGFSNLYKFPADESIYLFLLDPKSPNEKGLDLPIE